MLSQAGMYWCSAKQILSYLSTLLVWNDRTTQQALPSSKERCYVVEPPEIFFASWRSEAQLVSEVQIKNVDHKYFLNSISNSQPHSGLYNDFVHLHTLLRS